MNRKNYSLEFKWRIVNIFLNASPRVSLGKFERITNIKRQLITKWIKNKDKLSFLSKKYLKLDYLMSKKDVYLLKQRPNLKIGQFPIEFQVSALMVRLLNQKLRSFMLK